MVYHRQKYPEKEVDIDILAVDERDTMNVVTANVIHSEYGEKKVRYGFPHNQGWNEVMDGKKKFLFKLKDLGLRKLIPNSETRAKKEKKDMDELKMSERQKV